MKTELKGLPKAGLPGMAVHPGELLGEELASRGLSQSAFARKIGRPVQVINAIVNGKKSVTAETALDIEEALGIAAHIWTDLQADYDLVMAKKARESGKRSA